MSKVRGVLAMFAVTSVLGGYPGFIGAVEHPETDQKAETAPSVEYYMRNFGDRLTAEGKCNKDSRLAKTQMCINARKAANALSAQIGMKPEYPEVEDGGR